MLAVATLQGIAQQTIQPAGCIRAACTILIERVGYTDAELEPLARLHVPITIVYGGEDVAYSAEYYTKFATQLAGSGFSVLIHEIDGAPHLASATHYER